MVQRINKRNFCHYLALVNMLSFNFGYHVHEKAILLVTIPLTVMLFRNQHKAQSAESLKEMHVDIARWKNLKLLTLWTFWPLLYTMRDYFTRLFLLPLDWVAMSLVLAY